MTTSTLDQLANTQLPDVPASTGYEVARAIVEAHGLRARPPFNRVQIDASELAELFSLFAQLGLSVPGAMVVELAQNMTLYRRLDMLGRPTRKFGPGDLAEDDYADRYAAHVAAREAQLNAEALLGPARDALDSTVRLLVVEHLPTMARTLSGLYEANADDLSHIDRFGGAERDRLTVLSEVLFRAHDRLLAWGPTLPGYFDAVAPQWCTYWEFSVPAWIRLTQRTKGLETKPGEDGFALASECGGRPRLATSQRQAVEEAQRLQRGFKLWRANGGDRVSRIARKLTADELGQVLAGESLREKFRQRDADLLAEATGQG